LTTNLATNREHLTSKMYATDEALAVRIRTHELYTRPQMDFADWVLDHVPWRGDETVLDIGCGAGLYVEPVCARLMDGGRLLASDLSMGMLRDVKAKPLPAGVVLLNADAMRLPLPGRCCDVALANHILYHVPQIERAVAEAHRVLRPGGYFIAATNARYSMQRLVDEVKSACRNLGHPIELPESPVRKRFYLENGRSFIEPVFPNVKMDRFESALVFPTAEPMVAYINSMRHIYAPQLPGGLTWEALIQQVRRQIESVVVEQGEYRVPKTTGVFVATR